MHANSDQINRIIKFSTVTPSASKAVTLAEFKQHLDFSELDAGNDDLLNAALSTAIAMSETYTNRSWVNATFKGYADKFCTWFEIYKSPIQSVTAVKYYNSNNVITTMDSSKYFVDAVSNPARIQFIETPSVYNRPNPIEVEFIAGYGSDNTNVPAGVKTAIRLQATNHFEYREDAERKPGLIKVSEYLLNAHKDFYVT